MNLRISDLTVTSQLVFHDLHDNPWSSQEEMRDRLALSPSELCSALAQLEEHGLVDRQS